MLHTREWEQSVDLGLDPVLNTTFLTPVWSDILDLRPHTLIVAVLDTIYRCEAAISSNHRTFQWLSNCAKFFLWVNYRQYNGTIFYFCWVNYQEYIDWKIIIYLYLISNWCNALQISITSFLFIYIICIGPWPAK